MYIAQIEEKLPVAKYVLIRHENLIYCIMDNNLKGLLHRSIQGQDASDTQP